MGTKRKLLSILLAVCLAVGFMPTGVLAADTDLKPETTNTLGLKGETLYRLMK